MALRTQVNFPLPRKPANPEEQERFNDEVIQSLHDLVKSVYLDLKSLHVPGSIKMHGAATAPTGWLLCDGSAISRTVYADLFGIIGTTFGPGDSSTTFNVPDFRGIFPRGAGATDRAGAKDKGGAGTFFTAVLGTYQNDLFQGHWHEGWGGGISSGAATGSAYATNVAIAHQPGNAVRGAEADGANGTPQAGAETRPANLGITFIIKI
jgi:microcystin-dependent protein